MTDGVGMKFSQLAFIVTDDCNYNCSYCPQTKENSYMKRSTIEKTVEFFYPFLDEEAYIVFYGGEPLLAFDNIKYAVSLLQEKDRKSRKKLKYSITTNGSLTTDEVLLFFDSHRFNVTLSFDGLAQDIRKPGSLAPTRDLIDRIQNKNYPNIEFSTHSVFSPGNVNQLSASLQYTIECGVANLSFTLARNIPWDDADLLVLERELTGLVDFLVFFYKEKGIIPVTKFRRDELPPKSHQIRACAAGIKNMAISPEENLWGCYLFYDYLKSRKENPDFHTYGFGKMDDFIKLHETIYPYILLNYINLRQNYFFTANQHCFLCQNVDSCNVCPISAAYATSFIGKIPYWICHINRIEKKGKKQFLEKSYMINL